MDSLLGYNIIPIIAIIGGIISYIDSQQNGKSKKLFDHVKVAIYTAVIAGVVIFINSKEFKSMISGGGNDNFLMSTVGKSGGGRLPAHQSLPILDEMIDLNGANF